jgi:Domain of unknown function (DUF6894)
MPRYFFHLASPTHPVRDTRGVELAGLHAAHWHAMRLVYRLRANAAATVEDWVIRITDESGAVPLVVLPHSVPMLHEPGTRPELGGVPLKFGRVSG